METKKSMKKDTNVNKKTKIFVSAFACDPTIGSEPGVGWHWALELSKYYDVWLLTVTQDHGSIKDKIKDYFINHPEEDRGIHFIYYDLPKPFRVMKKNIMSMRLYYILWQKFSNKIVKKVMLDNEIMVFHLLTYGNMLWPVSSFGQSKYFVWGPTGGMDVIEKEYTKFYSLRSRIFESFRRIIVQYQKYNSKFERKCQNANLILCKANSSYNNINVNYRSKAILFTDVAMNSFETNYFPKIKNKTDGLLFLSAGHMDSWRGFDFLIESFAELQREQKNKNKLVIIGKGTELKFLTKKIKRLNAGDFIILPGEVSMEKYQELMKKADIVINSCLKEGAVTNAFDCMKWGKPLICIDTGGYTRNFDDNCAYILPRSVSRHEMKQNLKKAITRMYDPVVRKIYSTNIQQKGSSFLWEKKGLEFREILDKNLK